METEGQISEPKTEVKTAPKKRRRKKLDRHEVWREYVQTHTRTDAGRKRLLEMLEAYDDFFVKVSLIPGIYDDKKFVEAFADLYKNFKLVGPLPFVSQEAVDRGIAKGRTE